MTNLDLKNIAEKLVDTFLHAGKIAKEISQEGVKISIKADKSARMGLVSDIHTELRKADALMLNYSSKTAIE